MLVPCVICALKLDSTTNSELTEMEAGFEMRNHLIAEHSTYVAKSFLEPESTSNVHFWLCTNVLHEGPPTPVDVSSLLVNLLKTPSPNENLHSLFRHEDDEPKSTFNLKDYMDIKVDFSRKEPGKLANNNDYIASDLITTFARVAKESNNFDPMAIVSSFDLGIVRENGGRSVDEHPALPPPEGIDLKDDRICHLCWEDSRYPEMKSKNFSNYDLHRVKWHIKWIHKEDGQGLEPVSHESLYREEIDQLNEQSFPGWQHRKRPYWWIESSSSPTKDEPETFASLQKKVKLEVEAAGQVVLTKLPSDITEWTCQVCFKEFKPSSNFLRHVAKDHLSFPLYQCSICLGYGGQDSYEIRSHMMKVHNDHTSEPKSNIEGNAEEIQSMYNKCFPGRKFRLEKRGMDVEKIAAIDDVKIKCRECEMEMKLDDRQVHVYRHHLKEAKLYQCPHCDFSTISVDYHMREAHRDAVEGEVHAYEEYKNHLPELEDCGKLCFNDSAFDMD
uniref:C2H2-type domain-containing protein n=1 Tax=Rhabditophanes sp. KR3021 TaxID=114890 RepID=A0AC35TKF3_9BILA